MDSHRHKRINITIPADLLKLVDVLAKRDYASRSDFIRQALIEKYRRLPVALVNERERTIPEEHKQKLMELETLISEGISAQELTARLKELDGLDQ